MSLKTIWFKNKWEYLQHCENCEGKVSCSRVKDWIYVECRPDFDCPRTRNIICIGCIYNCNWVCEKSHVHDYIPEIHFQNQDRPKWCPYENHHNEEVKNDRR